MPGSYNSFSRCVFLLFTFILSAFLLKLSKTQTMMSFCESSKTPDQEHVCNMLKSNPRGSTQSKSHHIYCYIYYNRKHFRGIFERANRCWKAQTPHNQSVRFELNCAICANRKTKKTNSLQQKCINNKNRNKTSSSVLKNRKCFLYFKIIFLWRKKTSRKCMYLYKRDEWKIHHYFN